MNRLGEFQLISFDKPPRQKSTKALRIAFEDEDAKLEMDQLLDIAEKNRLRWMVFGASVQGIFFSLFIPEKIKGNFIIF